MNAATVLEALGLPPEARVDRRVPKKLFVEQGAPTAADKRHIQDDIEELLWVAALKPTNIGVPDFRDDVREYLEIAVLTLTLRNQAKAPRLIELIHRAVPYPVVLLAEHGDALTFSLAHKRWSQGEAGKVVLEESVVLVPLDANTAAEKSFLDSIALAAQPRQHMFALYQGWIDRVVALNAARITGRFAASAGPEMTSVLCEGLETYDRIQRELIGLRAKIAKETQINRRVEMNLMIKQLELELDRISRMFENHVENH